jgi:hypothetical protein
VDHPTRTASGDEVVDPMGWEGLKLKTPRNDPWPRPSVNLWKDRPADNKTMGNAGGSLAAGAVQAQVPPGALSQEAILSLTEAPVAAPSAQLRSTGVSFWFQKLLEMVLGGASSDVMALADDDMLSAPATLTVSYANAALAHLDTRSLQLYRWDEAQRSWVALTGSRDPGRQTITVQTDRLGEFDLQAPLICPAETQEPDDGYYLAEMLAADGGASQRLFDISGDEDWFGFDATAGTRYSLSVSQSAAGVQARLQLYDRDAVTVLAQADGAAGIEWQAPESARYYARLTPAAGSSIGCQAAYTFTLRLVSTSVGGRVYLPVIRK